MSVKKDSWLNGRVQNAEAVFLDLPAPWLALPHLSRSPPLESRKQMVPETFRIAPKLDCAGARFCTFSPCIEQTSDDPPPKRTVSTVMRNLRLELTLRWWSCHQKRFEIRRERIKRIDNGAQERITIRCLLQWKSLLLG